ncbi:cAMP-dependent protein kinase subunit, variant 2 [Cymbomonas tetramitiformis]|uniref:thiamine diphosphokinase n=1 Tax=Cymbomonas tetramitiformis TaxID=36881 RepID=A0AAE0FIP0_9CHLO|nr:cAMP-dependent protein kinase subunit, variant 2 [Cymbomonas tetramitiformis]
MGADDHPPGEYLHVTDFMSGHSTEDNCKHFLVVLNYNLPKFTPSVWSRDGGANRLFDDLPGHFPNESADAVRKRFVPDVIVGDLDSLRPDVRAFYAARGSVVIDKASDQDTTDLHKCIAFLEDKLDSEPRSSLCQSKILIVGGLGGRVDHEFGNYNVLHIFASLPLVLLGDSAFVQLLPRGTNRIIPVGLLSRPHYQFSISYVSHHGLPLLAPSSLLPEFEFAFNA